MADRRDRIVFDRAFFREQGKKRWKGVAPVERQKLGSAAGHSYWDKLSPEERSAEMKRRAAKRLKKKGPQSTVHGRTPKAATASSPPRKKPAPRRSADQGSDAGRRK
jgi:hypothetical protein